MVNYICVRCGVQHAAAARLPARCDICEDEREAVYREGQPWTTLADLRRDHYNVIQPLERDLIGICTEPHFAIGQQALLIQTSEGNVLWDCVGLLDDATIAACEQQEGSPRSQARIPTSTVHWWSGVRPLMGFRSNCTLRTKVGSCARVRRWYLGKDRRTRLLRV